MIGCAAMAATATGRFASLEDAVAAYVRYDAGNPAGPANGPRSMRRMQPVFDKLYLRSQALYDDLDRLARPGVAGG